MTFNLGLKKRLEMPKNRMILIINCKNKIIIPRVFALIQRHADRIGFKIGNIFIFNLISQRLKAICGCGIRCKYNLNLTNLSQNWTIFRATRRKLVNACFITEQSLAGLVTKDLPRLRFLPLISFPWSSNAFPPNIKIVWFNASCISLTSATSSDWKFEFLMKFSQSFPSWLKFGWFLANSNNRNAHEVNVKA